MNKETFGAETEKAIASIQTDESHAVSQGYFKRVSAAAWERGSKPRYHYSDIEPRTRLGVTTKDMGEQGLDNATNLLETASPVMHSLEELNQVLANDINIVQTALACEGATVINMSVHPLATTDMGSYRYYVAPKGIYSYLWNRGWDHSAGINAKAQNSPATGVSPEKAADALSSIIGFGAATVALFANSPISEGENTGVQESRLTIWDRMMKNAKVQGDRDTAKFPDDRIHTLRDYFQWMFGGNTGIHFVIAGSGGGYKTAGALLTVDGNPSVLKYLKKESWAATVFGSTEKTTITSQLDHMVNMQFASFAGARVRYAINKDASKEDFLEAMRSDDVEGFFNKNAMWTYIEGRDPGANFADMEVANLGSGIARSITISPSAIQVGVINNLLEAKKVLDKYGWQRLKLLREEAIKSGMDGRVGNTKVRSLVEDVLNVAENGLKPENKWMLDYPKFVLETGLNGATRALKALDGDFSRESIQTLIRNRHVIV